MARKITEANRYSEDWEDETNERELDNSFANLIAREPGVLDTEFNMASSHEVPRTSQPTSYSIYARLVGSMIGSGIFLAPSEVDRNVAPPVWLS